MRRFSPGHERKKHHTGSTNEADRQSHAVTMNQSHKRHYRRFGVWLDRMTRHPLSNSPIQEIVGSGRTVLYMPVSSLEQLIGRARSEWQSPESTSRLRKAADLIFIHRQPNFLYQQRTVAIKTSRGRRSSIGFGDRADVHSVPKAINQLIDASTRSI